MFNDSFLTRLRSVGLSTFIKSTDFIAGVVTLFSLIILFQGWFPEARSQNLLNTIAIVSASLFGIILTGLAIVTSFTDDGFLYAWKKTESFDDMITLFQFNLYLPITTLIGSIALRYVYYDGRAMIFFLAFFAYMLVSLSSLVNFVCQYGLQRGEFVKQRIEESQGSKGEKKDKSRVPEEGRVFTKEEMLEIQANMQELEELREKVKELEKDK